MKISAYRTYFTYLTVVIVSMTGFLLPGSADAGVYNSSTEVTYKEYWVSRSEYDGACGAGQVPPGAFFIEPDSACTKILNLNIPDDFSGAIKAEIYIDLWRNRDVPSAQFSLNGNTAIVPNVGSDWSRTPYVADVPMADLVTGANTITFDGGSPYHVHDVAIRIYYDGANPLVGTDVTAPTGSLTAVGGIDPTVGGTLDVDSNTLTLTATASDDQSVAYVEFHGYYYGYDEDNDGEFIDWHNLKHAENNPGSNGTIDHIGTDTTSPYSVTWDLSHIVNQSGVKFKVRIVDAAGNVREAAGGVSTDFALSRSQLVESHLIHKFEDDVTHNGGGGPDIVTRNIILPNDLSDVTAAYLVEAFWRNPQISFNGNTAFDAFASCSNSHCWALAVRSVPVADLVGGSNQIDYTYAGSGFGEFIEKPGPMIVLVRSRSPAPTATSFISDGFGDAAIDSDVWTYFDSVGDSVLVMTGSELEISVPGGVTHDLWENANQAPRILQPAADMDFEVEIRLDSPVDTDAQLQGLLVQEDVNKFIRFGIFTNNATQTRMIAAKFDNGVPTIAHNVQVGSAGLTPLYMRVTRTGDSWVQSFSADGISYTPEPAFTHVMSVRDIGVYTGNAGANPAHTGTFAYFTATGPVSIVTDPVSQTVNEGQTATFSADALGSSLITYQWQLDSGGGFADIAGATSASYTTPAVTAGDEGNSYRLVVDNVLATDTSAAATLTVNVPPTINTDPTDSTVNEGATATFTVSATGTGTLSYQWQKDALDIAGATSASYTTPATTGADDGASYQVIVTNTVNGVDNSVTSAAATLTVNVPPTINTDPADTAVDEGLTATFTVSATGSGTLSYQWQQDSGSGFTDIAGATSTSYTTPVTTPADDGTSYQVIVTNTVNAVDNSVTSAAATLTVNLAPVINMQPVDVSVIEGMTANFTVDADGAAPLSYQWRRNNVDIAGETNPSYTTPATTIQDDNGAIYEVVVSNAVGSVTSDTVTLTVTAAPVGVTITTQPADTTVDEGTTATFMVSATGTGPLGYQWRKDDGGGFADISGETSASYTTPATTAADNGTVYDVVVTNPVNSVTSAPATLTVNLTPVISTQPTGQTVAAGDTATFTVVATGTGPLSYQWQKDGSDVAGATSASYTTPATTVADDGSSYQVVVSNAAGSTTSSAATLTIDSNGDGLSDSQAIALGLDPNDADGDTDNDGTDDVTEIGGDASNPLDSDSDGVIDALEPATDAADASIASGLTLSGGESATISTASGETLSAVSAADASGGPAGIGFPFGTVSYTTSSPMGGSVTVRMAFSADLPANLELYKVDNGGTYTLLPASIWTRVDARTVDIILTDGDPVTDLDGVADGSIEDPVAPAAGPSPTGGGGGGGGGCTLNAAADKDPTLPLLMLMSLGYLLRRVPGRRRRRRRGRG